MHEPLSKARGVRGVSATSDSDGVADGWRSRWKRFALRIFRNLGSKVGTRKCAPPEFHTSRGSPKLIKIDKKGGKGQSLNLDPFLCEGEVINPVDVDPFLREGEVVNPVKSVDLDPSLHMDKVSKRRSRSVPSKGYYQP